MFGEKVAQCRLDVVGGVDLKEQTLIASSQAPYNSLCPIVSSFRWLNQTDVVSRQLRPMSESRSDMVSSAVHVRRRKKCSGHLPVMIDSVGLEYSWPSVGDRNGHKAVTKLQHVPCLRRLIPERCLLFSVCLPTSRKRRKSFSLGTPWVAVS